MMLFRIAALVALIATAVSADPVIHRCKGEDVKFVVGGGLTRGAEDDLGTTADGELMNSLADSTESNVCIAAFGDQAFVRVRGDTQVGVASATTLTDTKLKEDSNHDLIPDVTDGLVASIPLCSRECGHIVPYLENYTINNDDSAHSLFFPDCNSSLSVLDESYSQSLAIITIPAQIFIEECNGGCIFGSSVCDSTNTTELNFTATDSPGYNITHQELCEDGGWYSNATDKTVQTKFLKWLDAELETALETHSHVVLYTNFAYILSTHEDFTTTTSSAWGYKHWRTTLAGVLEDHRNVAAVVSLEPGATEFYVDKKTGTVFFNAGVEDTDADADETEGPTAANLKQRFPDAKQVYHSTKYAAGGVIQVQKDGSAALSVYSPTKRGLLAHHALKRVPLPEPTPESDDGDLSVGAIIGIAVGGAVLLAGLTVFLVYKFRKPSVRVSRGNW